MKTETRGPGRPPVGTTSAVGIINMRVTMERKNRWVRKAQSRQLGLSQWITEILDQAAWTEINKPS